MATKMAGKELGGILTAIFATSMAWCNLGEKHCCLGEKHCHYFHAHVFASPEKRLDPHCECELLQLVENKEK
jgi:hypothetical protein